MEEGETGIEGVFHNMGFVWEDVSPPYSGSHGHYEHNEMLFSTIPLFLKGFWVFVVPKFRWN